MSRRNKIPKNQYGHFSDDGREFIITTPHTPRPWVNVISNGDFGCIVSQAGGGYSWRTNAQLNRLTRWDQDILKDDWGKFIYIRDRKSGRFWSAAWKPVMREPDEYEVRHGQGYTLIRSVNEGIESEWLLLVAPDEPVELWKFTLRNISRKPRALTVATFFEWGLGASPDWHREFHKCFTHTAFDAGNRAIIATKRLWEVPSEHGHWNRDWEYVAFHGVNVTPSSFETSKEGFLGTFGSAIAPEAMRSGNTTRSVGDCIDPVGSLLVSLTLPPRKSKTLAFTLGAVSRGERVGRILKKYRDPKAVDAALAETQRRWSELMAPLSVETPDPSLDVMMNTWLKYQAISGRLWGRTGYYQAGGAYGFRDQLQDCQIFLPLDPPRTREQILLHARHQFGDGTVYHWWHPLSEVGLRTAMTDDLLWLPFLVHEYVKETGTATILSDETPFVDDVRPVSIHEHCIRAIEKTQSRFSPRGLPLIGAGDWNDGLSAVGLNMKGESVWLAHFYHRILVDYAEVCERIDDTPHAALYRSRAATLRETINREAWDGEWYYYGTKDSGEKIGSKSNKEGTIHLNAQTWGVIGDVADAERACAAMNAVVSHLEGKAGPLLLAPAYTVPDETIGYLTRYAPGTRENGAVYTHAATWAIMAFAKLKRQDDAYRTLRKLNPVNRAVKAKEYCAEPYVTPGNIDGPASPFFGRGGWTWYTGSAAWLSKITLEWILGLRPTIDGLLLDPCIPTGWKQFRVVRRFRGARIVVEVRNPSRKSHGIKGLLIDGVARDCGDLSNGALLPLFPEGTEHTIVATLG